MDLQSHPFYLDFAQALQNSQINHVNLLILSVPGMAVTYFVQKFLEEHDKNHFRYINRDNQELGEFNILDLNFDKDPKALSLAVKYFKQATLSQKLALVVNIPSLLQTEDYRQSYLASHIYNTFVFKVLDLDLIKIMGQEVNISLTPTETDLIYKLSGGLARLSKYLITNKDKLDSPISQLLADTDLQSALLPTAKIVANCDNQTLESLGLKKDGIFISSLLKEYFLENPIVKKPNIQLNTDLSFLEDNISSTHKLLKLEKQILENMMIGDGVILKEKIADFKWGQGSYDEYSDQAIGKTMQRLNKKLTQYRLVVIPKVGYKLERNS